MLVLDDLLVRPWLGLLEVIHDMALRELYDVEAIRSDLKENRLLYELGERSYSAVERSPSSYSNLFSFRSDCIASMSYSCSSAIS